ncbi:chemotaxis protein CheX [Oceanidesulfovibrio marinus]|uniref:Chemotaxis protein CheX n=1 Tax=Oceanidesulfovibrio marinus TaxID=370038 RepID=A0A6P1ZDF9_9BACT|nr:chemotaxis protein CheX [Oceanidesulfovibrio marinus]QJT10346.1 chemotaxis protein CheX [Oceanidesulfovibrio marinus]TVM32295.1 chemotaxis protein CheX [Oceanidesulfovibrio marinus]
MTDTSGVEIAKPFIKATVSVLSTMAMIEPEPGRPFVKKDNTATGDISAIIGVTGSKNGSISVSFTKRCAIAVVKSMLGDDIEDILQDAKDAVGEIANMISGQARASLAEMGLNFAGSTPSVVMGDNHTITHITSNPVVSIPFSTAYGEFYVEFVFE